MNKSKVIIWREKQNNKITHPVMGSELAATNKKKDLGIMVDRRRRRRRKQFPLEKLGRKLKIKLLI